MTNTELENASKIMFNNQEAEAIYLGNELLWSSVPYDCKIEYIESSGTQYIDTGIIINGPYKAEIEFETPSAQTSDYSKLIGVGNNENAAYQYCIIEINGNKLGELKCSNRDNQYISSIYASVLSSTINTISIESPDSNTMNVILNKESLGSVSNCGATYSKASSGSLYLFTLHNTLNRNGELLSPDTTGGFVSYKLYSFKFYLGNQLIRDMIPVRIDQIGYLYDKVSGQLFNNQGTGQFILGPDK